MATQGSPASPVLFCHLDDQGHPKCVAGPMALRALSVHVLSVSSSEPPVTAPAMTETGPAATEAASAGVAATVPGRSESGVRRVTRVLWGQAAGGGIAARCEADEVSGTVTCQAATEKLQP
jgi:hypothetical protein